MSSPLVCIVVVNYNGRDHLNYCLPSIDGTLYSNWRLIVVDNASTDGSADLVHHLSSEASLIRSKRNIGWAGGNNLGITLALSMGARYVLLANSDIRPDPRWVSVAVEVAEADTRIGVLGFDVLEPVNHDDGQDAGFEEAKARWAACRISFPRYVGGMAMFVRSELFEQIGLIDEAFFAYGEENDFQIRSVKAGYKIVAINVPVWHYGEGSFGRMPVRAAFLQTRNNIRLLLKHSSPLAVAIAGARHVTTRFSPRHPTRAVGAVERRLRASNPVLNFGILVCAVFWNIAHLRDTLRTRRADDKLAAVALGRWDAETPGATVDSPI